MLNLLKKKRNLIKQIMLYGIIGTVSATIDAVTFKLLLQASVFNYIIDNVISTHIGIVNSFVLNSKFNFKTTDRLLSRFRSFYFVGILGLVISTIILKVGQTLQYDIFTTKIVSIFLVFAVQFTINKILTFKSVSSKEV